MGQDWTIWHWAMGIRHWGTGAATSLVPKVGCRSDVQLGGFLIANRFNVCIDHAAKALKLLDCLKVVIVVDQAS